MPRILSLGLTTAKNQVTSTATFVWCFEIDSPGNFPAPIRFVSDVQSVVFQGATFDPFPVDFSAVSENIVGEKQQAQAMVANVDQQVISLLNTYWDAVVDPLWTVKVWQIYRADPDLVPIADAETFEVMSAETDLLQVTFELEQVAFPSQQRSTGRRYTISSGFSRLPRVGRLF